MSRYDAVNEKTTSIVTLSFTDESGSPVTPTSGTIRIDDLASGTEIREAETFIPSSSTYSVTITSDENRILDQDNSRELRCVTVIINYGVGKKATAEYKYYVTNLSKIT